MGCIALTGVALAWQTVPMTKGQELTATLRKSFHVNTRTRDYRDRKAFVDSIKAEMLESISLAVYYPGYYGPEKTSALNAGFGAFLAHQKHVDGYRIDGELRYRITSMTPWEFAGLLGDMVDAGVDSTGAGEDYYRKMRQAA